MKLPRWAYNILGNFGLGSVAIFIGHDVCAVIFNINHTPEQLIYISLVSGLVAAIFSASKEAIEIGNRKRRS